MPAEAQEPPTLVSSIEGLALSIEKKEGDVNALTWGDKKPEGDTDNEIWERAQYNFERSYYEVTVRCTTGNDRYSANETLAVAIVARLKPTSTLEFASKSLQKAETSASTSTSFLGMQAPCGRIELRGTLDGAMVLDVITINGKCYQMGLETLIEARCRDKAAHEAAHEKTVTRQQTVRKIPRLKLRPM